MKTPSSTTCRRRHRPRLLRAAANSARSEPDANGHTPSSRYPSAVFAARPARRITADDDGVGIGAVDVVLTLGGEVRQQPRMGVHDPGDPCRRRAAAGQGGDHVEVVAHTEAEPAVAAALQHLERPGLLERLDVLLRQPPVGVGLLGPLAQLGDELDGPFQDSGGHRDSFFGRACLGRARTRNRHHTRNVTPVGEPHQGPTIDLGADLGAQRRRAGWRSRSRATTAASGSTPRSSTRRGREHSTRIASRADSATCPVSIRTRARSW